MRGRDREAVLMRWVCRGAWNTAELFAIPLGRLAPWVFGGMVGAWPRRSEVGGGRDA